MRLCEGGDNDRWAVEDTVSEAISPLLYAAPWAQPGLASIRTYVCRQRHGREDEVCSNRGGKGQPTGIQGK